MAAPVLMCFANTWANHLCKSCQSSLVRRHSTYSILFPRTRAFHKFSTRKCYSIFTSKHLCTDDQRIVKERCKSTGHESSKSPAKFPSSILKAFHNFVEKLEAFGAKNFPRIFRIYEFSKNGCQQVLMDRKRYIVIKDKLLSGTAMKNISHSDQLHHFTMRRDYRKILPIVVAIFIPFGWVYVPIALMFPRILLPHQFLTLAQLEQRDLEEFQLRWKSFRPVLVYLYRHLEKSKNSATNLRLVDEHFEKLECGRRSSADEIQELFLQVFGDGSLNFETLLMFHKMHLCESHGMRGPLMFGGLGMTRRMKARAAIYRDMDAAIVREGLQHIQGGKLRQACMMRGMDTSFSESERKQWLKTWLTLSKHFSHENDSSFLLHQFLFMPWSSPRWYSK